MAKLLGFFTPDDPQWHELRNEVGVVTGTQFAAALGLSPWESPYTAWAKACGLIPSGVPQNRSMRLGQLLEPVVKQIWQEENPGYAIVEAGTYAHDEFGWARANPDGLLLYPDGSQGIVEIKTGRAFDEIPANYEAQIFWYMFVMGLKKAKLVALFFGSELREFDVVWDDFKFEAMFDRLLVWRKCVESGTAPDWDGSESTFQTVKLLNPDLDESSVELGDLGVYLINAQTDFDKAAEFLNEMKSRTIDALGSAKYGVVDDTIVCQRSIRYGKPVLTVRKGK